MVRIFQRVLEDCPNTPISVWCNEDTPMIWEEILREVAGWTDELVEELTELYDEYVFQIQAMPEINFLKP